MHTFGIDAVSRMEAERGQRHFVYGTIRSGEYDTHYASTAQIAETLAEFQRRDGYHSIRIIAPQDADDIAAEVQRLGRERREALEVAAEKTDLLRAATLRMIDKGASEVSAAQSAQVDRMTIRNWLGK